MWMLFLLGAFANFFGALTATTWTERVLFGTCCVLFLGVAAERYLDARRDAR